MHEDDDERDDLSGLGFDITGVGTAVGGVTNLVSSIFAGKAQKDAIKAEQKMIKAESAAQERQISALITGGVIFGVLSIGAILVYGAVKGSGSTERKKRR